MTERGVLFDLVSAPMRVFGRFAPLLIGLLLVIVANLPVSFTGGFLPAPALALAAVFFWAMVRPSLMPPWAVLVIGLAEDLLSGGPPGLWATGFVAAYVLIDRQRKAFGELYGAGTLLAFSGVVLVAGAVAYVLASIIYLRLVPIGPLLLEIIVTVILYPLMERPLDWVDRGLNRFLRGAE